MPKYNNPRKTWQYTDDFKVRAVHLSLEDDIQVQQVAHGLGIHPMMLSRWRKEFRDGKLKAARKRKLAVSDSKKSSSSNDLSELARIKRENERLKKENDLLKKWQRYLADQHQSGLDSSKRSDKS